MGVENSVGAGWLRARSNMPGGSAVSLAMLSCLIAPAVQAQDSGALSIKTGEADLFPAVEVRYAQDSNGLRTIENALETTAITVSPELRWVAKKRRVSLQALYEGDYENNSEQELNHADHSLVLSSDAEFSVRKKASVELAIRRGHENLGTNLTRFTDNTDAEQIVFNTVNLGGSFVYGASNARGNIETGLSLTSLSYSNRRDVTRGRDFTAVRPYGIFSLRVGADTRLLTELRFENVRFDASDSDRNDISLLAGIQFAATGKSGGTAKVGAVRSNPAQAGSSNSTDFITEGSLFWEPSKRSRFTLTALRQLNNVDSSLRARSSAAIEDEVGLAWRHTYSTRVSHTASILNRKVLRDCPDGDTQRLTGSFGLKVQLRRWLAVGANISKESADLQTCANQADQNAELSGEQQVVGVYFRATL